MVVCRKCGCSVVECQPCRDVQRWYLKCPMGCVPHHCGVMVEVERNPTPGPFDSIFALPPSSIVVPEYGVTIKDLLNLFSTLLSQANRAHLNNGWFGDNPDRRGHVPRGEDGKTKHNGQAQDDQGDE